MRYELIESLFPTCQIPACPKRGFSHMLPHQKELFEAPETYIYWQGGVGSAKTVALAVLAAVHMISIPGNEVILFRKDLGLNYKTLWKEFKSAMRQACQAGLISAPYESLWSVKKQGEYTVCQLPNGSRAYCGQTKNWSDYMGPSYGFIGVDDAMENEHEFFRGGGTVGGMQSRLRGAQAAYFRLPDGRLRDMRRFVLASNPPPYDHWLWSIFGRTAGVRELAGTHIPYRFILSNTLQNDHLPPTYMQEIASQHDEADLKRILQGESVSHYPGIRVHKGFAHEQHVGSFQYSRDIPLMVSLDPGFQHPAAVFMQFPLCDFGKEHCIALSEISNLYDVTTWGFMEQEDEVDHEHLGVLAHMAYYYPEFLDYKAYKEHKAALGEGYKHDALAPYFTKVVFCCDQAANKRSDSNKDKRTPRKIWQQEFGIACRWRHLGLEKSLNHMAKLLKDTCPCGLARVLINNTCHMLIEGYAGGYRYTKKRTGGHSDKPIEDHRFEDVADAHRYGVENFYLAYRDSPYVEAEAAPLKEDYLVLPVSSWEEMFT